MIQCVKEVVSDSPGLVDFAIVLVNSVLNLADGQVSFLGEFKLSILLINFFFRPVHARYSLPKWQAVKLTFFAP